MDIQRALNWRYAAKKLNPKKVVSEEKIEIILEAARKAPSSHNFQPWKIIVITDQQLKEKLQSSAAKQEKVGQSSHLIVLAALKKLDQEYIDRLIETTAQEHNKDVSELAGLHKGLSRSLQKSPAEFFEFAKQQTFIALGFLLLTAAIEEVDAGPMGGFNPVEVDKILGLDESNYASVVLVALGYRSDEDKYAQLPKVRFNQAEVIERR